MTLHKRGARLGAVLASRRTMRAGLLLLAFAAATTGAGLGLFGNAHGCCPSTDASLPSQRCDWLTPAACCDGRALRSAPLAPPAPPLGPALALFDRAACRVEGAHAPHRTADQLAILATVVLRC
jgi:hypothetical protein